MVEKKPIARALREVSVRIDGPDPGRRPFKEPFAYATHDARTNFRLRCYQQRRQRRCWIAARVMMVIVSPRACCGCVHAGHQQQQQQQQLTANTQWGRSRAIDAWHKPRSAGWSDIQSERSRHRF